MGRLLLVKSQAFTSWTSRQPHTDTSCGLTAEQVPMVGKDIHGNQQQLVSNGNRPGHFTGDNTSNQLNINEKVTEIRILLHRLSRKLDADGETMDTCKPPNYTQDWKHVSIILDRFFFLVYIVLIVVSLCVLFPRPIMT